MEATYQRPEAEFLIKLPRRDGESEQVSGRFADRDVDAKIQSILSSGGTINLRLAAAAGADTVGHQTSDTIIVVAGGNDDVEGHSLALRFPSARDAQEFQKRLLATGVIAGALVVGVVGVNVGDSNQAATGAGAAVGTPAEVSSRAAKDDVLAPAAGTIQVAPRGANDDIGIMDASGRAVGGATQVAPRGVDDDLGIMDASGRAVGTPAEVSSRAAKDDVAAPAAADQDTYQKHEGEFRGR